jgi:hypothetical protein
LESATRAPDPSPIPICGREVGNDSEFLRPAGLLQLTAALRIGGGRQTNAGGGSGASHLPITIFMICRIQHAAAAGVKRGREGQRACSDDIGLLRGRQGVAAAPRIAERPGQVRLRASPSPRRDPWPAWRRSTDERRAAEAYVPPDTPRDASRRATLQIPDATPPFGFSLLLDRRRRSLSIGASASHVPGWTQPAGAAAARARGHVAHGS